jgi:hypothetical protein
MTLRSSGIVRRHEMEQTIAFPKTIAAVQRQDNSNWAIGDALLEECGPPQGGRDGSWRSRPMCNEGHPGDILYERSVFWSAS